ncbi:MAG: DJ-1/PfpI family protein [Parvularculaceae bacterium]
MTARQLNIAFVLFPNVTQLDFTGPLQFLSRIPGAAIHLVADNLAPVSADTVLTLNPTATFDNYPLVDVLVIPGGFGVDDAMNNEALMAFVKREAARAEYVTSVCTGAFILGAAGLLRGKKATTHWAYHEELRRIGATPVRERVVRDGNIFTGGGVTAGIDFALTLTAELAGGDIAREIQLGLEYDPSPPFSSGSPEKVECEVRKSVSSRYELRLAAFRNALDRALT